MNPRRAARQAAPALQPHAIAIAVLALAAGAAQAQTAAAPAPAASAARPAAPPVETITITGFRASIESALNKKREDTGIVDVIRAEDIAKFPDSNIAESLQRVPGVVIARDGGEGRNITVRGLGGDFTRVRINGVEALATTGGTDSSGGNNRSRAFDFNVFASELFNAVTVRKSSSADVDEGSLGATVDLQTSRPFDFRKPTAAVSVSGRYNDGSGKTTPRASFLVSDTFLDRKVGVLLSGAYSKRQVYEEGFSSVRWDNGPSSGGWCSPVGAATPNPSTTSGTTVTPNTATNCGPVAQGVVRLPNTPENQAAYTLASSASNFHPRLPRYGRLTHDQDRLGITAALQIRPSDATLVTMDMLYAKLDATRAENYLEALSFSRTLTQGGKPQTSVVAAQYDANGALQYGKYNGVDLRVESRFDKLRTEFTQPTFTFEQTLSDSLKFTVRAGKAQSRFRNPQQTTLTFDALNVNGYEIDFRGNDRLPKITYPVDVTQPGGALTLIGIPQVASGTQPTTITNTTASEIRIRPQGTDNSVRLLNFTVDWEAIPDQLTLHAGPDLKRYTTKTFEFRRVNQNDTIFAPPGGATVASLSSTLNGFGKGLDIPAGTPTSWVVPNFDAIVSTYDIYCNCIKSGPAGGPGDFTLSSITNGNARGNNRSVVEDDTGLWFMGDFNTKLGGLAIKGNAGVRYVRTAQTAVGYLATGGGTPVSVQNNYSDWLPSLNLSTEVAKNVVLRFAAAKVMSRPQLGNLNPGGSISTTGTLSVTTGNPLLKPFRAKTLDASAEWYFAKNGFVGVGLFQKNISTYIQTLVTNIPFKATGLPLSLLPSNFNGDEVFQVNAPVNTDGGKLSGVELNWQQPFSFLPGFARNFGMLANYTRVKSKINYQVSPTSSTTIRDDLLNLSPKSWNVTFYYDDGTLSARISTSNRSAFLTRVPGQNNNDVEGTNGSTNVDASVSYNITDKLSVRLDGINLRNTANDQFISRARNSSVAYTVTGREYMLGMNYKF